MLREFKEFATKGDIMDLAIGVVIGGAFQKIVTSLVEDIIMPCVSMITGRVDFSDMVFNVGNTSIKYGNFITAIVNFLIIAFSIFLVVRYLNKLSKIREEITDNIVTKMEGEKEEEEVEPETKICPYCLTEVKYKATRCPHCTSDLTNVEEKKV